MMNAIESWNGGVILISHDERFITKVAKEVGIILTMAQENVIEVSKVMGVRRWLS